MTKEKLQERIKTLETEREQVRATLLAYEGALQESNHWLKEIENNDGQSNVSVDS
jgi:septal ring factor EnvC (AmiA/AmiB activator)